jgi:hypothetical protein
VADIGRKFRNVAELPLLPGRPRRRHAAKGGHQWFVVRQDAKLAALKNKTEVAYSSKHRRQLKVESGVVALRGGELLREERQGAPVAAIQLLQNGPDVAV